MTKPPVIPTKEYVDEFVRKRNLPVHKGCAQVKLLDEDRKYILGMLAAFDAETRPTIDPNLKVHGKNRYTPIQMYEAIMAYFKASLENGQPITITGIGLFCGIDKWDFHEMVNKKDLNPAYKFIKKCVEFMEMYIEFTGQKKQNPAFQIFWLKNRGWRDKFEIEATSTQGALTEDEREAAQKRIQAINEKPNAT